MQSRVQLRVAHKNKEQTGTRAVQCSAQSGESMSVRRRVEREAEIKCLVLSGHGAPCVSAPRSPSLPFLQLALLEETARRIARHSS